jgi:large conductance mechanosensitive channel
VFEKFEQILSRRDPLTIALGIAVGIATYYMASAIVAGLISPLIAAFIGNSRFELNSFSVSGSEFRYGIVIEYAMTLALVGAIYLLALRLSGGGDARRDSGGSDARDCPECTRSIPLNAKRCPYCTAKLSTAADG